jgi:hypothetical protein
MAGADRRYENFDTFSAKQQWQGIDRRGRSTLFFTEEERWVLVSGVYHNINGIQSFLTLEGRAEILSMLPPESWDRAGVVTPSWTAVCVTLNHILVIEIAPEEAVEWFSNNDLMFPDCLKRIASDLFAAKMPGYARARDSMTEHQSSKPSWNKVDRDLKYKNKVVLHIDREAKNQFRLLDSFEEEGWPQTISNPFKHENIMRQTVIDINRSILKYKQKTGTETRFCFRVEGLRPGWFLRGD